MQDIASCGFALGSEWPAVLELLLQMQQKQVCRWAILHMIFGVFR